MAFNTAAGAKLFIGTTTAASTQSDYEADTFQEVGTIQDLGEFGDAYNPVTFTSLADSRVNKRKGSADAGDMTLTVAFDGADQGQIDLKTALDDTGSDDYNFKVQLNDAVTTNGDGTIFYFSAFVMSRRIAPGGADNVVTANIQLGINTGLIEVAAT